MAADRRHRYPGHLAGMRHFDLLSLDSLALARKGSFAERFVNQELKAALKARAQPPVILTIGFRSIVAPLLAAMGFADAPLIAARMYSFADRRNGKLRMATRELGAETVGFSLVVTDSISDLEVLQSCARPLRTLWPQAASTCLESTPHRSSVLGSAVRGWPSRTCHCPRKGFNCQLQIETYN